MHERNLSLAAKGKAKESVHWQLGWWDLCHSLEGTKRPAQWSKSSVIYTAHEYEPRVVGRHFPSARQFLLPLPPLQYQLQAEPPTVLSLCPSDDWLFAYFPGKTAEGYGCIWHKEAQLDNWQVKEWWTYPVGGGIVAAAWSCPHREWVVTDEGKSMRLPALGPLAPMGTPLLLLVTESHQLLVFTLSSQAKPQQVGRTPLLQHYLPDTEPTGKIGGDKICMKAAIGFCYQDHVFLVAMRSKLLPSQGAAQALQSAVNLGLSIDISQPQLLDSQFSHEWELWGEEHTISLCEVRLEYKPGTKPVLSRPLPPIYHPGSLVDLVFYCPPPSRSARPSSSGSAKPDSKGPASNVRTLYLAATFFDPDEYTSLPKSEIVSYTFMAPGTPASYWVLRGEHKRQSQTKVPCFLLPSISRGGFVAGFLDAGGLLPRRKSKTKETATGAIEVLKLPDLSTHGDWDSVPILSHVQAGTIDVPASAALSPNETLMCGISSPLLGSHQSIQVLPRRVSGETSLVLTGHLLGDLSRHLVAAIHARYSPSDVIHALAVPTLPTEVTVNTLDKAFATMEADSCGLMEMWTGELLGVATEVYSARTHRLERGPEQDLCAARWQTAHEMSSLSACCSAFDTCREGDSYDLDAVWQLLGMTSWVIEFVEKILKECIFVGERPGQPTMPGSKGTTLDSPIFLHLVHPYSLSRLHTAMGHVKRFHDQVSKLTAKGENSHIAKDFLLDITEGSGVDLQLLGPFLAEILQESKSLNAQDLRRSLASCSPVPALQPHIRKVINKVLTSKAIDRARLFIKPSELSDGLARLSLSDSEPAAPDTLKDKNIDVVKKSALGQKKKASVCVRCGGRSEVALDVQTMDKTLSRWQTWEKAWQQRCVCGGSWLSPH
ncbi:hypothetical protein L226DRAFT_530522 [Lentinus tigrinus ALCF2SS1-7]|uniref:Mediator complex subunit 16 C-terminal domain-containing protein n=1 Tax=Lentinus tigrinus ALCF2SS1-6 TaxID=1328759 RepID=A0A5C2SSS2_9APHY|nr:hypothetical protein L227DRAFT_570303 [Lentinus tigrinus ALCF2SS1-6]RPD80352.1 hypothetical protein L226DRAFT_530522 [Lentinus tigrinus ALCF2SS1-7]